jgi:transglutaminase-like putative cysteine protease
MRRAKRRGVLGSWILACLAGAFLGCASTGRDAGGAREERAVRFEVQATVRVPSEAAKARIWVPLPSTQDCQVITNLRIDAGIPYRETRDSLYGNRMAYFEVSPPIPAEIPIRISFDARRLETSSQREDCVEALRACLLREDRLVAIDGEVALRAAAATRDAMTPREAARGIYDSVLAAVDYDKSGTGWGRGDTRYVCEVGKGNCTDFHALFIGMARARGIPASFEIGVSLPATGREGEIAGYHCWAWFEESPGVWTPVDASEADKDPSRREYFFGTLCCNRIAFTRGRDITLEPAQSADPLNYFIFPYVEVDGRPDVAGVERKLRFNRLGS